MKSFILAQYEKFAVGLAATSLALSGGWMWWQQAAVDRLSQRPVTVQLGESSYEPSSPAMLEVRPEVWAKPAVQSQGGDWLYEVFTPPAIHHDRLAGSFTVVPPADRVHDDVPAGLELIDVGLEPYRLQLAGYVGEQGNYLAMLTSPERPGTLLARSGQRIEEMGLTLRSIEVKKVVVAHPDAWPVYDIAASVVLLDEKTGAEVALDNRTRKLTDTPRALLRARATDGQPRSWREGAVFEVATATYRIDRIQLDPPEVVLTRQTPGGARPETMVLHPLGRDSRIAGKLAGDRAMPGPLQPGPATADR